MDSFAQELLQFHGNGKHRQNWLNLKELFVRNSHLVEQAALERHEQCGTVLLAYAHEISSKFRASLIVTLMLMYQMEFLADETNNLFIFEVRHFFDYITSQEAEYASEELALLAHTVTRLACDAQCAATVVPSLSRLSSTVSPSVTCLTAIHADILQACISGKMYSFAHDFISDTSILEINPKKCFLETSDFLKYFYYSGIVYIAVKDFQKALECFDEVLSFPAEVLSAVCVEAYKKAILVSLIQNGKVYNDSFPSTATAAVKKMTSFGTDITKGDASSGDFLSLSFEPYRLIENHFKNNDLNSSVLSDEAVMSTLAADSNAGLAKQTLEAMYTHRIVNISKAYMSVSLDKLTTLINGGFTTESMEKKLLHMNKQGIIIAKISNIAAVTTPGDTSSTSSSLVTFYDLSTKYTDSVSYLALIRAQLSEAALLSDKLRTVHGEVLCSDKYLKKSVSAFVGKGEGGGGGGGGGMSLVDHDVDMDMMEDEYYE